MVVGPDGRMPLPWLEAPLREALQHQRAHALLVRAAQGVGGLEFMLGLAQAWLCEAEPAQRPCGRCASCGLLHAQSHPDLFLLVPEALRVERGWLAPAQDDDGAKAKRKPSRQIRIDDVRAAIDWVARSSSRARAKVVLLYPAEAMNPQSANALLKTLEEPPGDARLLLGTTDPALLLPTVRSRCQLLALQGPTPQQAVSWLAEQDTADPVELLAAAGGRPLLARSMAERGIDARSWQALPRAVLAGRASVFAGWPIPLVIDALAKLCHDAMRLRAGGEPLYFAAQAVPCGADAAALNDWARALSRSAAQAEHPWNETLLVEALVAQARLSWQDATTAAPSSR